MGRQRRGLTDFPEKKPAVSDPEPEEKKPEAAPAKDANNLIDQDLKLE